MLNTNNPIIKHKAGLLNLAEELQNVSRACKVMGVSRDTFYRYQGLAAEGGLDALINKSRRVPNLKNRIDEQIEKAVMVYAVEYPAHGQHRTSNELRKTGVFVSGSGVRSIWLRNNLDNFKKRLKALEQKVATEGFILNEAQVAALEKKKDDDVACGEIETAHPGYLGSQDTFYVGNMKGVGRIYQQTYVDSIEPIVEALKGHPVQRIIIVSSTRVYGENAGEWLDDESAVHPTDEYGYMLYDMEQQWRKIYANQLIILRPSGIYTEYSAYMTQLAYKTTVYPHVHYCNRIHQDDLVDFLVQLADLTQPKESYIVSNLQPLALHDVIKGRQRQLGLAMLHVENLNKITGKRLKPKH